MRTLKELYYFLNCSDCCCVKFFSDFLTVHHYIATLWWFEMNKHLVLFCFYVYLLYFAMYCSLCRDVSFSSSALIIKPPSKGLNTSVTCKTNRLYRRVRRVWYEEVCLIWSSVSFLPTEERESNDHLAIPAGRKEKTKQNKKNPTYRYLLFILRLESLSQTHNCEFKRQNIFVMQSLYPSKRNPWVCNNCNNSVISFTLFNSVVVIIGAYVLLYSHSKRLLCGGIFFWCQGER